MKHSILHRVLWLLIPLLTLSIPHAWGASPASSTSFSSLSGNIGSDANISYAAYQGSATTASEISSSQIKLYRSIGDNSGGVLVLTANNGVKITKINVTFTGVLGYRNSNSTSSADRSNYTSLTSGSDVTISNWDYVQISNIVGKSTKTQAFISAITVTYSSGCSGTTLGTPSVTATPSSGQVVLTWPNVSNASSYQLKWNGGEWESASSGVTKTGLTNGTAYTYQVKAIGNGSTYCDGNPSAEASATPNVYYTVTWNNNGSEYTTTSVVSGSKPEFPSNPTSCDGTSTTFYGWTASPWSGKIDDISAKTIYTSASSMPTVTGNGVVYHAVFCKGSGGSITLTSSDFHDNLTGSYADQTIDKYIGETKYTFNLNACEPNDTGNKCQMRDNSTLSYIQIPTLPGVITRFTSTSFTNASDANYTGVFHFKSARTRGNANTNDIAKLDCTSSGISSLDWDVSSDNSTYTSGYLLTSAGLRMADLTIYYGSGGSKYLTNCCTELGTINGSFFLSHKKMLCTFCTFCTFKNLH